MSDPSSSAPGTGKREQDGLHAVAGQTLWNLLGMISPLVVALVAIPILLKDLGEERFGMLGIIGLLIGYLSVFDLGIGQAQAYWISDARGRGETELLPRLFQTSLLIIFLLGILLGLGIWFGAEPLGSRFLKVSPEMMPEMILSMKYAAFAIPLAILAPCLVATLEAFQEFRLINLLRIPTSASYFLAPLCVLPFTEGLPPVILAMAVGRLFETLAFGSGCLRRIPGVFSGWLFSKQLCGKLLGYGGWMTLTNILAPLMIHGDRFILGSTKNLSEVAFYVTPAEFVIRLLVLPRALVTVLFPNLTIRFSQKRSGAGELLLQCGSLLAALLGGLCVALMLFGPWALSLWLGKDFSDFAAECGPVLRWLSLGMFFLGLTYLPQFSIQAAGKPKWTALLFLAEVPLYLYLARQGAQNGGAAGIAMAWSLRCAIDFFAMSLLATKALPEYRHYLPRLILRMLPVGLCLGLSLLPPLSNDFPLPLLAAIPVVIAIMWFLVLGKAERKLLLKPLGL